MSKPQQNYVTWHTFYLGTWNDLGFNKWNSQLDNFIEFPDPQDLNEF